MIYTIVNILTKEEFIDSTTLPMGIRFKQHRRRPAKRESRLVHDMKYFGHNCFYIEHIATALHIEYLAELKEMIIAQNKPAYNYTG